MAWKAIVLNVLLLSCSIINFLTTGRPTNRAHILQLIKGLSLFYEQFNDWKGHIQIIVNFDEAIDFKSLIILIWFLSQPKKILLESLPVPVVRDMGWDSG